jgi:hypothetical protein
LDARGVDYGHGRDDESYHSCLHRNYPSVPKPRKNALKPIQPGLGSNYTSKMGYVDWFDCYVLGIFVSFCAEILLGWAKL